MVVSKTTKLVSLRAYLVVHQHASFALAVLHDLRWELWASPPLFLEADSPGSVLGEAVCGVYSPIRGEIDPEAILKRLHLGRRLCVAEVVVC